jgi:hypothetical protein
MYRYQWGVYWVSSNKCHWGMEWYSADIEILISGWNTLYYSDNILSQIAALRDIDSHREWLSIPITPIRRLENASRNIWTITFWKEHFILPTHLISHHLIFIYLDMSGLITETRIHGRSKACFGYLKNFKLNSDRYIRWRLWRLDEKVTAVYWYPWRVCQIATIFLYLRISANHSLCLQPVQNVQSWLLMSDDFVPCMWSNMCWAV